MVKENGSPINATHYDDVACFLEFVFIFDGNFYH